MRVRIPTHIDICSMCGDPLATDGERLFCKCREPFPVPAHVHHSVKDKFDALVEYARQCNREVA